MSKSSLPLPREPIDKWNRSKNDLILVLDKFLNKRFVNDDTVIQVDDVLTRLLLSQYISKSPSFAHVPSQLSFLAINIPPEVKEGFRKKYEPLLAHTFKTPNRLGREIENIAKMVLTEYRGYFPAKGERLHEITEWCASNFFVACHMSPETDRHYIHRWLCTYPLVTNLYPQRAVALRQQRNGNENGRGFKVIATRDILNGEILIECCGLTPVGGNASHTYLSAIKRDQGGDRILAGPCRFLNHDCINFNCDVHRLPDSIPTEILTTFFAVRIHREIPWRICSSSDQAHLFRI